MLRFLPYTLLFLMVSILQIFIFDKLIVSPEVAPLVYVAFIVLLPMRMTQLEMLAWGVGVGIFFDLTMGMAGVNSIATIFVSFFRYYMLSWIMGRDALRQSGAPTVSKMGIRRYLIYVVLFVAIHSVIFYSFESLNFTEWELLLRRILFSSVVTVIFVYLISSRLEQLLARNF